MSGRALFGVPRRAPGLVDRSALESRLDDAAAITTIAAGAGFGKTALLASWASSREHTGVWIDGSTAAGDRVSFWRNAFALITEARERTGSEVLRTAVIPSSDSLDEAGVTPAVAAFARSLGSPFVLIIDNAHMIDLPAIASDLVGFSRFADGSRLIVSDRHRRFRPTLLASDVEETRLTGPDLVLSADEIARLIDGLGARVRNRVSPAEVHRLTGGIVGLARRVVVTPGPHPERGGELLEPWTEAIGRSTGDPRNGATDLAAAGIPPAHLIAALGRATADEAARITGMSPDEASRVLQAGSDHGLGWWEETGGPAQFTFARIASIAARSAVMRLGTGDQRRRVAARFAQVFAERGEAMTAFGLALDAEDYDLAVAIGKRSYLQLIRDDTQGTLQRLRRIPLTKLRRQPLLVLFIAMLHAQSPRGRAAALFHFALAERLARATESSGAADDRAIMVGVRGAAMRMQGKFDRAVPVAREFLDRFDRLAPEEQDRLSSLSRPLLWQAAHTLFFAGQTDTAVGAAQRMLAVPVPLSDGEADTGLRPALSVVSAVSAVVGSMGEARAALDEALVHPARASDFYLVWERTTAAIAAIEGGDFASAVPLIDSIDHDMGASEYWPVDAVIRALAEVGDGRLDGAIRVLEAVLESDAPPRQASPTRDVVVVLHALLCVAGRPAGRAAGILRHVSRRGPAVALAEAVIALRADEPVSALGLVGRGFGDATTSPRVRASALLVRAAASSAVLQDDAAARAAREAVTLMSATGLATPWMVLTPSERSTLLALVGPELAGADVVAAAERMPAVYLDGARVERLTARERDVLARLVAGDTIPQVAEASGVSSNTVKTQRARIYRKLGVDNRADAARVALEHDLL